MLNNAGALEKPMLAYLIEYTYLLYYELGLFL